MFVLYKYISMHLWCIYNVQIGTTTTKSREEKVTSKKWNGTRTQLVCMKNNTIDDKRLRTQVVFYFFFYRLSETVWRCYCRSCCYKHTHTHIIWLCRAKRLNTVYKRKVKKKKRLNLSWRIFFSPTRKKISIWLFLFFCQIEITYL